MIHFCLSLVVSLLVWPITSPAQEVIHAAIGTVTSIDSAAQTITLLQAGTTRRLFKTNASGKVELDKRISKDTQQAASFQAEGAFVVVFYFGEEQNPTAIALRSLGKGPFASITGKVTNWDRHRRAITVTDAAGAVHQFKISPETIADTSMGSVDGARYQAQNGDRVRVVSELESGESTALFVNSM